MKTTFKDYLEQLLEQTPKEILDYKFVGFVSILPFKDGPKVITNLPEYLAFEMIKIVGDSKSSRVEPLGGRIQ